MKAATTLRNSRPDYTPALVALAAIHESHGAFLGGNFVDCPKCKFHAVNSSEGEAIEHDPNGNFRRTYAVKDGEIVLIHEWKRPEQTIPPSYPELVEALRSIDLKTHETNRKDDFTIRCEVFEIAHPLIKRLGGLL